MAEKRLTHIAGTFLIQAEGAFLNGAGIDESREGRNTVIPKTYQDGRYRVPYVSAQAWRRWLRETFKEEYPDEPATELRALSRNARGNPEKIGTLMDPVVYAEDDIFGYMRAEKGQGRARVEDDDEVGEEGAEARIRGKQKGSKTRAVVRASPFVTSILKSIRSTGWQGDDEGFVHLKDDAPLPYKTRFYNTHLQGIFSLGYDRLGVFRNEGDRIELDEKLVAEYLKKGMIARDPERDIYRLRDNPRRERASRILRSLAVLRGGAKQAQFGTDVAPKAIIIAGLNCGNPIFNDLFEERDLQPVIKLDALAEVIEDYRERLVTPVFIGARRGYLHPENERELVSWARERKGTVEVSSPIKAIEAMIGRLSDQG